MYYLTRGVMLGCLFWPKGKTTVLKKQIASLPLKDVSLDIQNAPNTSWQGVLGGFWGVQTSSKEVFGCLVFLSGGNKHDFPFGAEKTFPFRGRTVLLVLGRVLGGSW